MVFFFFAPLFFGLISLGFLHQLKKLSRIDNYHHIVNVEAAKIDDTQEVLWRVKPMDARMLRWKVVTFIYFNRLIN